MLEIQVETFRLSPLQRHLYALQGTDPYSPYRTYCGIGIKGSLDILRLQGAVEKAVERHEILHTVFPRLEGSSLPVQVITENCSLPLAIYDLSSILLPEQEKIVPDLLDSLRSLPFYLYNSSLFRVSLVIRAHEDHLLLIAASALIADIYTCNLFIREIGQFYDMASADGGDQNEYIQYADMAEWQYELLESADTAPGRKYWQSTDYSCLTSAVFPTMRTVETSSSIAFDSVVQRFSEGFVAQTEALAQRLNVSVTALFLSCWLVVLRHITGQSDLFVGTGYDGRKYEELLGAMGLFAKYVPLPFHLSDESSFSEFVRQIDERLRDASLWQEYFGWELLKAVDEEELEPFCSLGFDCGTLPPSIRLRDLVLSIEDQNTYLDRFHVRLSCVYSAQGLLTTLHYDRQLFDQDAMERLLAQWQTVLVQVLEEPHSILCHLQILTSRERHLLLQEWNATDTDYPRHLCVHTLVDEQVGRSPDRIAVVYEDHQLTYHRLCSEANRLAQYLQHQGVGPEVCVGLFLERSIEMLVALLGILKAGGAYVPLDVSHPQERLTYILQDSEATLLLTQEHLLEKVSRFQAENVEVLVVDRDWSAIVESAGLHNTLVRAVKPENLAYVIYTSGSTGKPKGVMVSHASICNTLCYLEEQYPVTRDDAYLLKTNYVFDVSLSELFGWFFGHGHLVVLPPHAEKLPEVLIEYIQNYHITHINFVPAMLGVFLHSASTRQDFLEECSLKYVMVAGEAFPKELVQKSVTTFRHARIENIYGPTEAAIYAARFSCSSQPIKSVNTPIGRPIANTQLYILNPVLVPVPIGVQGELCIAGVGLARGYVNLQQLSAEKFIENPFHPGTRLYKTGDLARWLPDGTIEFLGRIDHQVKIRGFRVELGEIEARLLEHPAIREAVVVAQGDSPGDKRLAAYIVGSPAQVMPSTDDLRVYLQSKLPDYMVPSFFLALKKLPLTTNGKVDREALPVPGINRPDLHSLFVPPQTEVEAILASIWSEVLHIKQIGIYDNFFSIGGDSILSIQVVTLAKQSGIYLVPRQLFQYQTIAQLASVAQEGMRSSGPELSAVSGPVLLTPIQRWFFSLDMPERHHYNFSGLFEVQAQLGFAQLQSVIRYLLVQHDALRLRFTYDAAGWHQYQSEPTSGIPFIYIDLSNIEQRQGISIVERLSSAAQKSLDLTTAPLLRSLFFGKGGTGPGYFVLIVHHLAMDGVSWRILLSDLETALSQIVDNKDIRLPAKTASFQYWSQKLYAYAQSEHLLQELPYWLASRSALIKPLPLDLPAGSNTRMSSEVVSVHLDAEQTHALLQHVPSVYHTQINDILLTSLVRAFASWTGQSALLVDLEGHGREEVLGDVSVELSRTVGWFTTLFPVLLDIGHATTIGEEIKAVKEQLRQIPQRGIGYGLLRYLRTDPDIQVQLAALPVAQVSFNYLGQFNSFSAKNSSSAKKSPMRHIPISVGSAYSDLGQRSHLLTINGNVIGGQLQFDWEYSRHIHRPETIQQLAQGFIDALHDIIVHCQSPTAGGYTPSDFPLAALDQPSLDQLVERVRKGRPQQRIEDIYPLSPMQAGMLFHSLYAPTEGVYHEQFGWIIPETLNIPAWQWSWQQVVNRHAILRTIFLWQGMKEPLQVVLQRVQLDWHFYDWRGLSVQEQRAALNTFYREDSRQDFDLEEAPPLRLALIYLGEHASYFFLSQHHLLWDGWSQPLLLGEVQSCYQAYCSGSDPVLPLVKPYRDYITWLKQQDMQRAEQFWREYLSGFVEPTILSVDRNPSSGRSQADTASTVHYVHFTREETKPLQDLARQHGLTMNTIAQGAWAWLLALYSGSNEVVFGATVAGRSAEIVGMESMIGLFINTLPIRVQIMADMPLVSWLAQLQEQQAEMRQYEYTPLTEIKRWSEIPADQPLFESILLFQNYPSPHKHESKLTEEEVQPTSTSAASTRAPAPPNSLNLHTDRGIEITNYPLDITVGVDQDRLFLALAYQKARFDAATIQKMMEHLQLVLVAMGARWDQRLIHLPRLTSTESKLLLSTWNATARAMPPDQCLHHLIESQVTRRPDAVAVQYGDHCVSYTALNHRANQLARLLTRLGVGPDCLVGVSLPRSLELMIALLAILKAGGAYTPLDPSYPREQLQWIVDDAQPAVLIVQDERAPLFQASIPVVAFTEVFRSLEGESSTNRLVTLSPDNLAYLLYTSGSTGRPKGVMTTHRGVCNHLLWRQAAYALAPDDCLLQKAPLHFDVSIDELFWPLVAGARLVLARPEGHMDNAYLIALIMEQSVTSLEFVPSLLAFFMKEEGWTRTSSLRQVMCGGEALSWQVQETFFAGHQAALYNTYGPTETAVDACSWTCQRDYPLSRIPIGRPVANTQVYLLDARGLPVPIGVKGELYIGGAGLARGYYRRPDLTAWQFIPHPFSQVPGARLYRSGDLTRYREDGAIEYLGRVDEQVKRHGVRIEPGEIEFALRQHSAVDACVVTLQGEFGANPQLIAYVTGVSGESGRLTVEALRQHATRQLPAQLVPARFVLLEKMPLNAHGKVDRQRLPQPEESEEENKESEEEWSPIEELLRQIWTDVLAVSVQERKQSFFALGGHSLLVTRVISRIREVLQVELPLRAVFEAPTLMELAQLVQQEQRKGHGLEIPPLQPVERSGVLFPLSFAQQRLWFLDQLEPGSTVYLISEVLPLEGRIDLAILQRSLQQLVQRHESLRTTFEERSGQPVQVIHPAGVVALPLLDLQAVANEKRGQQVRKLIEQEKQQPCDLRQGPLLRLKMLRLGPTTHVLLFMIHHIISDAWSSDIFYQELTTLYAALSQGRPAPLAPLPIQYADYAVWQRQWLQGAVLEQQLAYWRDQLAGVPPLELPTDYPRPPIKTYRGAIQSIHLSVSLSAALVALSKQKQVTLFMLLLSAFQVLLARYSGQADIAVGTPIANRNHRDLEGLIGFFVNTLVMRSRFKNNPGFAQVLEQVREVALGAYAHQDVPFEQLVEMLQPERDLSRSTLFQVMFTLQQPSADAPQLEPPAHLPERHSPQVSHAQPATAKFDLTLDIVSNPQGFYCKIDYSTDLFEAATIQRLLHYWQCLLEGIVAHPETAIFDLPLLPDSEVQLLRSEWNATTALYPLELCLHEQFEGQVTRTPDAVALVFEEEQLTYWHLNRRANQLARQLQACGVGLEAGIGICLERSPSQIIAVLATLKAAGVYLPLDPQAPPERLAWMLQDAQVALVLTQQHLRERLPVSMVTCLCLDADWQVLAAQEEGNLRVSVDPAMAAYVLYTSGSTGQPKGVVVEHRQVMNYIAAIQEQAGLTAPASYAMLQPLTVDSCVTMLFPALLLGGVLHLISYDRSLDARALARYFLDHQIDYLKIAPSHLFALMMEKSAQRALPRRKLIIGGEASQWNWVQMLQSLLPAGGLYNHYGPTETTVGSLLYPVMPEQMVEEGTLTPLGRPLGNTHVYVLDPQMRLQPLGVVGELYIGGAGLTRGYVGRPDVTAERFLPHPWSQVGGERLYKTGDLVRYRTNGTIEFVGRGDEQVKIRGYRIEPGEIEGVLGRHPAVQEARVVVVESEGQKQLIGYLVGNEGMVSPGQDIRDFIRKSLPDYMVPSGLYWLEELPRTPHGKVNRNELVKMAQEQLVEPEMLGRNQGSAIEELVAGMWCQVLAVKEVKSDDQFFALGGHSLLAAQLISRIRATFQIEIPLRWLFETPKLIDLAKRIEEALRDNQGEEAMPLAPVSRQQALPLSFAQMRLWFLYQLEPGSPLYVIPGVQPLHGILDIGLLERSLEALVQRHESLRTTFQECKQGAELVQSGQPMQIIHPVERFCLPVIDLSSLAPEVRKNQARYLPQQAMLTPFNLTQGPLLRTWILRLHADDHLFVVMMHHIISDGWSMNVFYHELRVLYQAFSAGQPSPLQPLPIQYADFAAGQRQQLQGKMLEQQLDYWRQQLSGASPLVLPTDYPRPAVVSHRGSSQSFSLSSQLSQALITLSRQEDVTPFMLLLTAFQILFYRYSGQKDIVIGTDSANRNRAETENLIGFFINILALRTTWHETLPFRQMLRHVREMMLEAYTHQETPFELLVDKIVPDHALDQLPLVQVLFVMQNFPEFDEHTAREQAAGERQKDAPMQPLGERESAVKFDLALFMEERAGQFYGSLNYCLDLFTARTIATMIERFATLLQSIVQQPDASIDQLDFLTVAERKQQVQKKQALRSKLRSHKGTRFDLP